MGKPTEINHICLHYSKIDSSLDEFVAVYKGSGRSLSVLRFRGVPYTFTRFMETHAPHEEDWAGMVGPYYSYYTVWD